MAILPELDGTEDLRVLSDPAQVAAIAAANTVARRSLSDAAIEDILAFLATLEDPAERLGVPDRVPSGLPVDR